MRCAASSSVLTYSGKSELAQLALHNPHIWATERKN